jgi:hypothetical protein
MGWKRSSSRIALTFAAAVLMWSAGDCAAQIAALSDEKSPAALVQATVSNELAASRDDSIRHMFRSRKQTTRGSQTKLYIETAEAMAALLIANDDKPISEQQQQSEWSHLEHLTKDREDLRRKQKQEHEDSEHALRIVKALPEAFVYEFDGTERGAHEDDQMVRLKFRPNPSYDPPSHVEQVLAGMQGNLLIDKRAHRLARIDAVLFREVSFGWGILGHLNKGGSFFVEQADVGDGTWQLTHMRLSFTGKVMMVKSITIKSEETFSDFRRVPSDITFAKGVEMLKAEQARLQTGDGGQESSSTSGRR